MKKSTLLILIIFILFAEDISAQTTGTIRGIVRSSITSEPLLGVTVRIEGLPLGGFTDKAGKFEIKDIPIGNQSVRFSYVGYNDIIKPEINIIKGKIEFIEINMIQSFVEGEEITIRASYFADKIDAATSTQVLSSEYIAKTPGAQEDVIRAVQLLPGVNITSAGRNDLIVRGGAPFENLYIIDDIKVPNINHFGSQGSTGGPVSIVNIDYVEDVEFSAGGFGARYGDKISSMTNIRLRNGNSEQFRGRLDLSATGIDASIEGPTGENASYFISARRSYLDFLFKLMDFGFIPQYWDFQGKYNWKINDDNYLTIIGFGVLDDVKLNNDTQEKIDGNASIAVPKQKQYILGATWKHLLENGYAKFVFSRTYTNFETFQNDSSLNTIFQNYSREAEIGFKAETELQLSKHIDLITGNLFEYGTLNEYDVLIPGFLRIDDKGISNEFRLDTNFHTIKNATYATVSLSIDKLRLTSGIRADYYNMTKDKWHISPRLAVFYYLNNSMTLIASLGRYYQAPQSIWLIGDKSNNLKALQADQMVIGLSHMPMEELKIQVEAFYKLYNNYPARIWRPQSVISPSGFDNIYGDIPYGLEPISSEGNGISRGLELYIQKKISDIPIWGLFSLTYAQTSFTSLDGIERAGSYDSRFITNLSIGYNLRNNWEISGKFRASTGVPTTPFDNNGNLDFSKYNEGERLPFNHQLDIRVDKKWYINKTMLNTYLDIQNIYNQENVFRRSFNRKTRETVDNTGIGILPSIGILFEF